MNETLWKELVMRIFEVIDDKKASIEAMDAITEEGAGTTPAPNPLKKKYEQSQKKLRKASEITQIAAVKAAALRKDI